MFFVTPAKAGVQKCSKRLDSRLRGNDGIWDFLGLNQDGVVKVRCSSFPSFPAIPGVKAYAGLDPVLGMTACLRQCGYNRTLAVEGVGPTLPEPRQLFSVYNDFHKFPVNTQYTAPVLFDYGTIRHPFGYRGTQADVCIEI